MDRIQMKLLLLLATFSVFSGCQTTDVSRLNNSEPISTSQPSQFQALSGIQRIAIISLPKEHVPERQVEAIFIQGLSQKGYTLTSRSDLDSLMQEQSFQRSGLTEGRAARLGKILKADAVLVVEVTDLQVRRTRSGTEYFSRLSMAAKLIDVESSNILWANVQSYRPSLVSALASLSSSLTGIGKNNSEIDSLSASLVNRFPNRR